MKTDVTAAVEPQFFTKAQAATYTGLSVRSIDVAREQGTLTFYRHGTRVLLKREDLDRWIERFHVRHTSIATEHSL
jgi:excisionase family DNA binding protein